MPFVGPMIRRAAARAPRGNAAVLPPAVIPGRSLVLAACVMATFMAAVESTIVATAMPSIVADLGGFRLLSWVFSIYLLTQAVTIPIYGRLADLFGRKKVFYVGTGFFLVGSALSGFAPDMLWLILFRALQGIGAGGVQPIAMTICGDIYTPAERARVQGLISSVFGVAAVVGPSLGAFLVEHGAWPVVFWVNLPVGAASIVMISLFLRERVEPRARRIDYAGSLLITIAAGGLILLLVQGSSLPGGFVAGLGALVAAAVAMLIAHEARTPEPMLPLDLWHDRVISVGSVGGGLVGAVMMGVSAFLPTYVQGPMGLSPTMAGLVLGVMSVTWALASIIGGRLMVRTSYRFIAALGTLFLIAGSAVLVTLTPERGAGWAALASLVIGVGMGLCNTAFIVSIQAAVAWAKRGAATSSCLFLRFIGQALGAAAFGALLNLVILRQAPNATDALNRLLDPGLRGTLSDVERVRLTHLVATGLNHGYWLALGLSVAAFLLVLLLPKRLGPAHQVLR